jgi:N-methylhydantoinase A
VLTPLDESSVKQVVAAFNEAGVDSIAICLIHAYANPQHEERIAELIAMRYPGLSVSLSSGVSPSVREFDRLCTTAANAYVRPLMDEYLS